MDVIVDGAKDFAVTGEPEDAMAVLGAVTTYLEEQERVVVSVLVDGESISPEALTERLEGCPLDDVGVLEVGSEAVGKLVSESLERLREAVPELPEACRTLAEIFHGETPEEGFEPFTELANIWSFVKRQEHLIAHALSLDVDEHQIDGVNMEAMHEALNGFLKEAVQALEDGDCVLLGDLLEYELAPRAEQEAAIVALLQEQAQSKTG